MKIDPAAAIHLLHASPHAVLATNSTPMPGYPYATAVPLVVDDQHRPLLLISALAEHTRNLLADGRASLAVSEAGQVNIQNAARLTLVGRFEPFEPEPEIVARYLRYLPDAGQYLQLDFMFFRMNIERTRYIGGVGRMGWLEAADWQGVNTLAPGAEATLLAEAACHAPSGVELIGLDAHGLDYTVNGIRGRQQFATAGTAGTAGQLAEWLPAMVRGLC